MNPTAGWYPVKLERQQDGAIIVHWQDLTGVPFVEPFFEDTMRGAKTGRGQYQQTTLMGMQSCDLPPPIEPTAFIFHTSRSGSTLLTQLLSCLDGSVALSEPPIVDELLQLAMPPKEKSGLIRTLIRALAQARPAGDRNFFIKYDCWHIAWLPLIKQAFPDTPCFFVYRDPVAILWSHHRQRGSQMVPGLRNLEALEPNLAKLNPADLDGYAARVLEAVYAKALPSIEAGELMPLDHAQLLADPVGSIARLAPNLTAAEQDKIRQRSRFHSKQQGQAYTPEIEQRIPELVRGRLEELAAPRLQPAYEALRSGSRQGDELEKRSI
jgi:hypothetical protein